MYVAGEGPSVSYVDISPLLLSNANAEILHLQFGTSRRRGCDIDVYISRYTEVHVARSSVACSVEGFHTTNP